MAARLRVLLSQAVVCGFKRIGDHYSLKCQPLILHPINFYRHLNFKIGANLLQQNMAANVSGFKNATNLSNGHVA